MAEEDKESKTEEPTEKKRGDAFEKGRTASSKEVNATIVLFVAACLLYATGGYMRRNMSEMMAVSFSTASEFELTVASIRPLAIHYISLMGVTLAPLGIAIMLAGIISSIAQNGGLILSAEPIMPKFNKLNPIKGFGRFFSRQAAMELFKSLFKIAIVGTTCYQVVKSEWTNIPALADQSIEQILIFVAWVAIKLIMFTLLIMLVMAIADFIFQKHIFEESLKMSKQEVKDERKNTDGNPITKQRIRTAQMNMARKRMMSDVPKAEVVITNPTHLAIAIAYDRGEMEAPIIVAKGAGLIAEKIKAVAKENDIPVVEDKPLARILFKTIDIGRAIPEELYKAIAEILAYVYKLKAK
jgi:flagellar biosynthetic protein FlhB